MKFNRRIAIAFVIIVAYSSGVEAATQQKIRHWFLLASVGDVRLYSKTEKARKKLVKAGNDAVPFLITQLGRKNIRKIREAERALKNIGTDAVPYLIEAIADTNENLASISAVIIGDIGDSRALTPLLVSARHGYTGLRASSCYALGKLKDSSAVPILIDALSDTLASVRRLAALSLGRLGDKRAMEPLFKLLADSSYAVRYTAQNAIAKIGDGKSMKMAFTRMDSAKIPEKYHLIVLLGAIEDEEGLPMLENLLQDTNHYTRGFACEALGHFRGNWRVANMLKRSLHDNSPFVRMKAKNALGKIKNSAA